MHTLGRRATRVVVQRFDDAHPTRAMPVHRHAFFELFFLERGGGTHRFADREVPALDGDLFVIAPGETHDTRGLRGARGWVVAFDASAIGVAAAGASHALPGELLLLSFLRPSGSIGGHFRVPLERRAFWTHLVEALRDELAQGRLGHADAARWYLKLLLLEATRLAAAELSDLSTRARPLLARVFAVIEARFREPISLAHVAREVGRSRSHLTALVRRETGRTVLEWIHERRLTEARRLLLDTDLSVERVAEACGFPDASYFTRRWRAATRTTPHAWRARHRRTDTSS